MTELAVPVFGRTFEEDARLRLMLLMTGTHRCAACGGGLVVARTEPGTPPDYADARLGLVCSQDRGHSGYRRRRSWTERYDSGEPVPVWIADRIEKKRGQRGRKQGPNA